MSITTKRINRVLALVLTITALTVGQSSAWAVSTFSIESHPSGSTTTTFTIIRSSTIGTETVYYRTVSLSAIAGNTLCLPFDVVLEGSPLKGDNVVAMTLDTETSNLSGGTLTLNFTAVPTTGEQAGLIPAGTPFIIKWATKDAPATNLVNPVFTGVTVAFSASAEVGFTGGKFVGSYSPVSFEANDQSKLFLGADNTLYWPNADMTVGAFRAYFDLGTYTARSFNLNFGDEREDTQGIVEAEANYSLSTIHSSLSDWYDMQGRKLSPRTSRLSPLKKGLYINNGRKIIVK